MSEEVDVNKVTEKAKRRAEHIEDKLESKGMGRDQAEKEALRQAVEEQGRERGAREGGEKIMTQKVYDPSDKHPPEYQRDMNPEAAAGINYGSIGPHPERENPRTAHDVKEAHRLLKDFTDDQLKQIPILPAGSRLEQDATYIDLASLDRNEFKATSGMSVPDNAVIVPKSQVDYQLWNRLRGVTDPARTGAVQGT